MVIDIRRRDHSEKFVNTNLLVVDGKIHSNEFFAVGCNQGGFIHGVVVLVPALKPSSGSARGVHYFMHACKQ